MINDDFKKIINGYLSDNNYETDNKLELFGISERKKYESMINAFIQCKLSKYKKEDLFPKYIQIERKITLSIKNGNSQENYSYKLKLCKDEEEININDECVSAIYEKEIDKVYNLKSILTPDNYRKHLQKSIRKLNAEIKKHLYLELANDKSTNILLKEYYEFIKKNNIEKGKIKSIIYGPLINNKSVLGFMCFLNQNEEQEHTIIASLYGIGKFIDLIEYEELERRCS